ncbi:conjugal transfer protein [Streptococcus anginosus]|uniref:conjugal transfer protein n=1 Tax=Streptococcus anginosus TaxID=1328 RepID=UPI0021F86052|nr:conjugal transfer protein [Streptococcus anginosus]MCW1011951.1 conjugal transfer protein [Streptococcus anginosus]
MNNKYRKNIEKQKEIDEKIEELKLKKEILKEEQEEMESACILKEYRSIDISIDEFLEMIKSYKKDELKEKRSMQKAENIEYMEENDEDQI